MDTSALRSTLPVALLTACDVFRQGLGDFVTAAGGTVCASSAHATVLERLLKVRDAAVLVTDASLLIEARTLADETLPLLVIADTLGSGLCVSADEGLAGVLIRPLTQTTFVRALITCAEGLRYRPRALTAPFMDWVLSERQQEVLVLHLQGATTAEIAQQLGIDQDTVRSHQRHMADRLGVAGAEELRAAATLWWQQTWFDSVPLHLFSVNRLPARCVEV